MLAVVTEKPRIEAFLRRDPFLHLYALGDLDDFFWRATRWFAWEEEGRIEALFLLYGGAGLPVLLALERENVAAAVRLAEALSGELPDRFYAHLSAGMAEPLRAAFDLVSHGVHWKMGLRREDLAGDAEAGGDVTVLGPADRAAVEAFYREAYPGNWFDPRMLETGQYLGGLDGGRLVAVAGIHVYSATYRVAALGNIATHPACRGRGWARRLTAALCRRLFETVDLVGLNVHAENRAAIACYTRCGFQFHCEYEEFAAVRRAPAGGDGR